jgi:hypothetical protein
MHVLFTGEHKDEQISCAKKWWIVWVEMNTSTYNSSYCDTFFSRGRVQRGTLLHMLPFYGLPGVKPMQLLLVDGRNRISNYLYESRPPINNNKKLRNPWFLQFCDFLITCYLFKTNKFLASWKPRKKRAGSGFETVTQWYGAANAVSYKNVTDPEYCCQHSYPYLPHSSRFSAVPYI